MQPDAPGEEEYRPLPRPFDRLLRIVDGQVPRYARISKRRACELCGCRHATGRHPAQGEDQLHRRTDARRRPAERLPEYERFARAAEPDVCDPHRG